MAKIDAHYEGYAGPERRRPGRTLRTVHRAARFVSGDTTAHGGVRVRFAARRTPTIRRRLMLALAAAEEELMRRHADAAADFVRETAEELPFERALAIYMRLVDVPARDRRLVAVRALSLLERELPGGVLPQHEEDRDRLVQRIARRIRGRRDDALRARVSAAAARARRAASDAYLRGAEQVVMALEGVVSRAEAVQYFVEAMDLGPGWAEHVFHQAVGHRQTDEPESAACPRSTSA